MIKVMIERRVKKEADISVLLRALWMAAMNAPGYISGETLINAQDKTEVVAVATWSSLKEWREWEKSEPRVKILEQIKPLLAQESRVRVFQIAATERGR
ncbi:MAG: antibiotic biosynthesis monooxygenase [Chloroflexota bacterium]